MSTADKSPITVPEIDFADCVSMVDGAAAEFEKLHSNAHYMFAYAEKAASSRTHEDREGNLSEMRMHYIEVCQAMHGLREELGNAREQLEEWAPKAESPRVSDVAAE